MNKKIFVCAEMAQGFEGDYKLSKSLIKAASKSGADAVKFQVFKAEELCTNNYKYYDLFKSLEMPSHQWNEIVSYAKDLGLEFHSDVFGLETLNWAIEANVDALKIHSSDMKNYSFLNCFEKFSGKIYLSVGGSEIEEIDKALNILDRKNIVLISGFQAEPNLYSDVELDKIQFLKKRFNLPISYADHIDANDPLAISLPAMAVLKGADEIEKHLTIERDYLELEDSISALNPSQFKKMVKMIRGVEGFFTDEGNYTLSKRELIYRKNTKKVPIAARGLKKGTSLTHDDITFLRTGEEVSEILDIDFLIGKSLSTDLGQYNAFSREMLGK